MNTLVEKFSSRHTQREKLPGRHNSPTRRYTSEGPARREEENTKGEEKANRNRAELKIP
jgi:hypothetical protein